MTTNKKTKALIYTLVIIAIVGIIAYPKVKPLFAGTGNSQGGMNPAQARGPQALRVQGMVISPRQLNEFLKSTGTLMSDEETDLAFETSGRITAIHFDEGTHVRKGQLLAKINDRHLQAQLQRLMAQKNLAQDKEFRQRSLLERDAISKESYEQIVTEIEVLEADISLVEARIAETELRAPFDGVIGLRNLSEGSYVNPNTHIARLVKNKPLKIEFSVPEKYSGEIKSGFPVRFVVDGISESFDASVYAIDPKIDLNTKTIIVRALYPNTNEELKPGGYANITLQILDMNDAVAIPTEAIIPEMAGEKVFVYKSGRAQAQYVTIGHRNESHIQILNGLEFGDTLLTSGVLQLRPDMPVEIYQYGDN
ncbi:MAG: efflux RND transporter periplasmic adaptor subunit [Bacteroidales bacterium]